MNAFRLVRVSDPAAMPIGEPEDADPWSLELDTAGGACALGGLWTIHLDDADQGADPISSLLAFLAYLDTPIRITGNGRGVPTIEILDVPPPDAADTRAPVLLLPPEKVVEVVARITGTKTARIIGSREQSSSRARQMVVLLLREQGRSYPEIGRELGQRDHGSAMDAHRTVLQLVKTDAQLSALLIEARRILGELGDVTWPRA